MQGLPTTRGPIYCETLGFVPGVFPAETWNTYSNLVIIFFGFVALYQVIKWAPRAIDLYILCALLIVNGAGSFLWHGTRTGWALTLDVTPGLIFLFAMVFFWARRLWGPWQAGLVLGGFYVLAQYSRQINLFSYGRWAAMMPAIIAIGAFLIVRTVSVSKPAALLGVGSIASAMVALTFRTWDMTACEYIPFGTHFLWHMFLSGGAFMGVMALILLARADAAKVMPPPRFQSSRRPFSWAHRTPMSGGQKEPSPCPYPRP